MPQEWTRQQLHLLSDENIENVRRALAKGWVFGIHYYYGGGGSGDCVAFKNIDEYLNRVTHARAGDLLTLWSVDQLRDLNSLIAQTGRTTVQDITSTADEREDVNWQVIDRYLAINGNELLAIADQSPSLPLRIILVDAGWKAELQEFVGSAIACGATLVLAPLTEIDARGQYLIRAKRPNADGEVPLRGSY